jgi:hypothetical protein
VDDTLLVRRFQRRRDLARDIRGFAERERSPLQISASPRRDELHREKSRAALFVQAEDRGDAGVAQRSQDLGLALEAGETLGILRERLGENLIAMSRPSFSLSRGRPRPCRRRRASL